MFFTLLKNYKIPIINSTVAIETIVSVKTFLRNFLITFSKCSMFTVVIVEPVAKFGFCFPNAGDSSRLCISIGITFFGITIQEAFLNFKSFLACFCSKRCGSTYRITNQTSFFPTWFTSSTLVKFG